MVHPPPFPASRLRLLLILAAPLSPLPFALAALPRLPRSVPRGGSDGSAGWSAAPPPPSDPRLRAEIEHARIGRERRFQFEQQQAMFRQWEEGEGAAAEPGAPPPAETAPEVSSLLEAVRGRGPVNALMFLLVWRAVGHYEHVDGARGARRLSLVVPVLVLIVANLSGLVVSLTAGAGSKTRMKAILNLNKVVEAAELGYNGFVLLCRPDVPKSVREEHMVRMFSNIFFLVQLHVFTKASWGISKLSEQQLSSFEQEDAPPDYYDGSYQGDTWSASPEPSWQQ